MINKSIYFLLLLISINSKAQELFVITEPASNISAKSLNVRAANYFMNIDSNNKKSYHLMPEFSVGVNNKLMLRLSFIASNRVGGLDVEGYNLYAKYRFLSLDDVHKHLRMAVFSRFSKNVSPIHMQEHNLLMHNSGYELGTVATQLLHKTAISANLSYQRAINTDKAKFIYPNGFNSINYALSVGQLIFPKKYVSYKQVNFNTMVELIGQYNTGIKGGFVDIVPSIQFIVNSTARIDLGYRTNLQNNIIRSFSKGFILKLEYNFFSAFK
jgi:hypothetical protein